MTDALGTLSLASLRDGAFEQGDVDLSVQVAGQVAIAVEMRSHQKSAN